MKKNFLTYFLTFSAVFFTFFTNSEKIFALNETPTDNTEFADYDKYLRDAKAYCDSSDRVWGKNTALVTIPQYPKLDATVVNEQINRTKNLTNISEEEKTRLVQELDLSRIGNFTGFKTLEVARLQYRASMDSLFACSLASSRLKILADLQEAIAGTFTESNSEIKQQLEKEKTRLERERDNLNCNSAETKWVDTLVVLKNSATRQYCHYRYYLNYLDAEVDANRARVQAVEEKIGNGNGTTVAQTALEWANSYDNYKTSITSEIDRADSTLPRAFRSLRDMERTYPAHLLLTIIYDDYIRLRKNLSAYMNASTQTYLKAYNAQDANNR